MYRGSIEHSRIIEALRAEVPDCYVRDYRDRDGFITVCRGYKDIAWKSSSLTNRKRYVQVPDVTLASLPQGNVQRRDLYSGARLLRTGWFSQFQRAMPYLTYNQRRRIQHRLHCQVWPDILE